ncbi:hypothetical protein L7F22_034096 [Adiantum nelumboides]|nr:hypothetical protein [Adiantum nelumboides]
MPVFSVGDAVDLLDGGEVVAKGRVVNVDSSSTLYGQPMPHGHVSLIVVRVLNETVHIPYVPPHKPDLDTLADVVGYIIAWPSVALAHVDTVPTHSRSSRRSHFRSSRRSHSSSSSRDSTGSKYSSMSEEEFEAEARRQGFERKQKRKSFGATSCFDSCFGRGSKREEPPYGLEIVDILYSRYHGAAIAHSHAANDRDAPIHSDRDADRDAANDSNREADRDFDQDAHHDSFSTKEVVGRVPIEAEYMEGRDNSLGALLERMRRDGIAFTPRPELRPGSSDHAIAPDREMDAEDEDQSYVPSDDKEIEDEVMESETDQDIWLQDVEHPTSSCRPKGRRLISCKEINPKTIVRARDNAIETVCLLEEHFPTSILNIQVHLLVHLVDEVEIAGTVHARWMFFLERFMKTLKGFVRQRA